MTLSIIFFLLYLGIVVTIGIVSARKESEEEFMIAGRAIKGFQVTATMAAGFFDGAILSIYLAYIYQFGLSALWAFVGFGLGFLLVRRYAPKIKQKADEMRVYTMPEYFSRLLGKRVGLMVSLFILVQFFLLLVVNLIISGKVLSVLALAVAIGYQNILALGLTLASLNIALFPLVWGSLKWKIKESAAFWSLICAFVSIVILFVIGSLNPQSAVLSLPVAALTLIVFNTVTRSRTPHAVYG